MTDWIPIEKFKSEKGQYYVFFHPADMGSRTIRPPYLTVDTHKPSYSRTCTLYAKIDLPEAENQD